MSINDHGFSGLTMQYEQGGKVQVFRMGDKEVRVGPDATTEEIKEAFRKAEQKPDLD